ncbi:hypothetical protein HNQ02_003793 [Flavobacterium sp. 7E]|uniref:hypothetical protein n=1 Tax=Flavobacterium sp. 7E TaxID=2735898 RepID=UPI00156D6517|nr:hypothetical protein [Flavobacterium sp. 7E]NRS90846.1 hypothetical protein [Flavobacterium sp. 7E]
MNQTINEKVFDEFSNNEKLEEVKDFIKNKGLNQALIVPNFENFDYNSIKELLVDLKELSKNGLVEFITPTSTQAHFLKGKKDELRDFLIVEQDKLYGSYKGIIIFVTVIHSENIEAGFSWVLPRENNVVIIPDGFFHGHTYLHEISHALGLEHTFSTTNSNDVTIEIMKKNITIYKDNIEKRQEFVNRYKNNKSTEIINFSDKTKKSVKEIREEGNAEIKNQNKLLVEEESNLNDTIIVSNKYYFPQASTDNIMDYGKNYDTNILNSNTVNNTFHKYQILLIQDGLKITLK